MNAPVHFWAQMPANIFRASKDTSSLNPSTLARGKYLSKSVSSAESARPKNSANEKPLPFFLIDKFPFCQFPSMNLNLAKGRESRSSFEITTARGGIFISSPSLTTREFSMICESGSAPISTNSKSQKFALRFSIRFLAAENISSENTFSFNETEV